MRRGLGWIAALSGSILAGCNGVQSALDPKGPAADELANLIWLFTVLCAVIWVLVMAVLVTIMLRRRQRRIHPLHVDQASERTVSRVVISAVAATGIVLVALTLLSFFANRTLAGVGEDAVLTIRLTGQQWWWEVKYENAEPSKILTTANEIHIPAGEQVRLVLQSDDVIHSFWVPSLHGKLDLIPGVVNSLTLKADKPGVYRGQCAEFCGLQHAHMAMLVIAQPRADFDAWYADQLRDAAQPLTEEQSTGRDLFLDRPCVMCHRIQGTTAGGTTGPDLTHVASRRTLAAGTLQMSRGSLAAWIADPQSIKWGAKMPVMNLTGDELNAIVAYLENLK
ncbi:cytochrome c oxidase subunit II [Mesorhizobium sp. BAC0120]|uniref:cytochrome c oxidase subunit II n=1 Tax=Mesorhizobium sp. BAC0120 TaxID=3090670 RepID=UPI00298D095A|nr:cytochrome c oxidase subunit II [Mesorhizobium sp. BAC0120]MDW6020997.1 cytochrome c oxidase subunit II [Mesorhizobium sp. BAC0120]